MMNLGLRLILILVLLLPGCSSTDHLPGDLVKGKPDKLPPLIELNVNVDPESANLYLQRQAEENKGSLPFQWLTSYLRAQILSSKNPEQSCPLYTQLARDKDFPIYKLARLRAIEICPSGYLNSDSKLDSEEFVDSPWLEELAATTSLNLARKSGNKEQIMHLAYRRSKSSTYMPEKIQLTQEALSLAKDLQRNDLVREYENRLLLLSPSLKSKPQRSDWLAVASDLRRRRQFRMARSFYARFLRDKSSSANELTQAWRGIRACYKLEENKPKFIWATERLVGILDQSYKSSPKDSKALQAAHDGRILLARSYWTEGKVKSAIRVLRKIEKDFGKKISMSTTYWLRARIAEESGNYLEALNWLNRAKRSAEDNTEMRERILWSKAWNLRKVRQYHGAIAILEQLAEEAKSQYARSQYSFWLAKSYAEMNDQKSSAEIYQDLIARDPLGYYGILSHRELKLPLVPPLEANAKGGPPELIAKNIESSKEGIALEWLIATNEKPLARLLLDDIGKRYQKDPNINTAQWTELFRLYAQSGSYLGLFTLLGELKPDTRDLLLSQNPHLLFPRPYKPYVSAAASRYGISSELIYSIMRQESAFNPFARSSADAFGLMQILPRVAKTSARKNQIPLMDEDDLFKPHVNIPVGSAYLSELWEKYNGQFILAVASYNASETAIQGWLDTRFRGDSLEFIEDIPYEETRSYVKLVMRNLVFYQRLYSSEPIQFPEWCLEIIQDKQT